MAINRRKSLKQPAAAAAAAEAPKPPSKRRKSLAVPASAPAVEPAVGAKRKRQSIAPEVTKAPKRAATVPEVKEVKDLDIVFQKAGKLYVLGTGDCGQLGLGEDVTEKSRPGIVKIDDDNEQVVQVVAGGMHTACLCESGKIFTWGVNDEGALGRYTEGEAWKNSGLGKGTPGDAYTPAEVTMPKDTARVIMLSAGDSHTAALTAKGDVYVWGTFRDSSGVMGFSQANKIQVTPCRVWAPSGPLERCTAIASGTDHIAALTAGHAVLTWGSGQQGQLGREVATRTSSRLHAADSSLAVLVTPAPMRLPYLRGDKPAAIACGHYSTFVVTQRGRVYACGLNNYGQLGVGNDVTCMTVRLVKSLSAFKIAQVAGGEHHSLALDVDGKILAFGRPTYGRLGCEGVAVDSDEGVREPKPVVVPDLEQGDAVVSVVAGGAISGCVSSSMCGLWLWGFGTSGQLGKGDSDDSDEAAPTKVKRTKAFNEVVVTQLSFGGQHAVMLGVPTAPAPARAPAAEAAPAPEQPAAPAEAEVQPADVAPAGEEGGEANAEAADTHAEAAEAPADAA